MPDLFLFDFTQEVKEQSSDAIAIASQTGGDCSFDSFCEIAQGWWRTPQGAPAGKADPVLNYTQGDGCTYAPATFRLAKGYSFGHQSRSADRCVITPTNERISLFEAVCKNAADML